MEYDVENHLIKVITPSETLEFKYDSEGKRVKKVSSNETVIYISGSYEIRITDGQQKLIKHIFTGSDRTITVEKTNNQTHTYYCHVIQRLRKNQHNSIRRKILQIHLRCAIAIFTKG